MHSVYLPCVVFSFRTSFNFYCKHSLRLIVKYTFQKYNNYSTDLIYAILVHIDYGNIEHHFADTSIYIFVSLEEQILKK